MEFLFREFLVKDEQQQQVRTAVLLNLSSTSFFSVNLCDVCSPVPVIHTVIIITATRRWEHAPATIAGNRHILALTLTHEP